jgi:hypothetical protein
VLVWQEGAAFDAPEADEAGALRCRLVLGKAAEPPEARPILQRLGELYIREVMPGRQQQGPEQGQRRPSGFPFVAAEMPAR